MVKLCWWDAVANENILKITSLDHNSYTPKILFISILRIFHFMPRHCITFVCAALFKLVNSWKMLSKKKRKKNAFQKCN